jgi:hypothetical protein
VRGAKDRGGDGGGDFAPHSDLSGEPRPAPKRQVTQTRRLAISERTPDVSAQIGRAVH